MYPPLPAATSYGVVQAEAIDKVASFESAYRYYVKSRSEGSSSSLEWTTLGFDDSSWLPGAGALGYDTSAVIDDAIETSVEELMLGQTASALLRIPFEYVPRTVPQWVRLQMRYDDGYAVYVNGQEVAVRNSARSTDNRIDCESSS